MTTITYIYADSKTEMNTSLYMAMEPARAINRTGKNYAYTFHISELYKGSQYVNSLIYKSDAIIIERNFTPELIPIVEFIKNKGKLVLGWFDDDYNNITPDNISYPYWKMGRVEIEEGGKRVEKYLNPIPIDVFKEALGHFHAYLCPSKVLMRNYSQYGNGYYIPNRFDIRDYINIPKPQHEGINIFWGGSLSHLNSFNNSGLYSALKRVCSARPQANVLICGDKRVYDAIKIPETQKRFLPFVPREDWAKNVANADIGLAVLYGSYDQCRSWIKPMEYFMMGIPCIASDNKSYDDISQYLTLVKNSPKNWELALLDHIDNIDEKREFAKTTPYEFSITQDINLNVDNILGLYRQIAQDTGVELKN